MRKALRWILGSIAAVVMLAALTLDGANANILEKADLSDQALKGLIGGDPIPTGPEGGGGNQKRCVTYGGTVGGKGCYGSGGSTTCGSPLLLATGFLYCEDVIIYYSPEVCETASGTSSGAICTDGSATVKCRFTTHCRLRQPVFQPDYCENEGSSVTTTTINKGTCAGIVIAGIP